eukprot:5371691-Prorocentrum_lima.AAC.1
MVKPHPLARLRSLRIGVKRARRALDQELAKASRIGNATPAPGGQHLHCKGLARKPDSSVRQPGGT